MRISVNPQEVVTWDVFIDKKPPHSVALDGYVLGAPMFSNIGPHVNFNHHEGVDRLSTRSTSGQVLMALKMGLLDILSPNESTLFVNDSDQDCSLSIWLFENYKRLEGKKSEPAINRLVQVVDFLDVTSGMYPIGTREKIIEELAWVFEPHVSAKISGELASINSDDMKKIILSIGERISKHIVGRGDSIELDTRYKEIGGGKCWSLIEEIGFYARSGLADKGINAFISVKYLGNNRYTYSMGKTSPFISFPIVALYEELNNAEGINEREVNSWGGSDTIGGSPRKGGSRLAPQEVEDIVNNFLQKEK